MNWIEEMKRQRVMLLLLGLLLSSGCATSAVRGIGERRVCDNGGHAVVLDNGDIVVVRERSELTGYVDKCISKTNVYFYVPARAINIQERIPSDRVIRVDYSQYILTNAIALASCATSFNEKDAHNEDLGSRIPYPSLTNETLRVVLLPVGLTEVMTYRTFWGRAAQVLLLPAIAVDAVTFPVQLIGALVIADTVPQGH
jgi:hypothetical protein